jgi:hypothetical protein
MLIDISTKLNWSNLSKKLNYLNYFYKNHSLIFYQNKINKNIIHDKFDEKIKKIIENPFNMYEYLNREPDFIKWTNFISYKIKEIYYSPMIFSSIDIINIGKLIYLLYNITDQNINNKSYNDFINFCNKNENLILNFNRINIKIKEYLKLKININLGILAKHLIFNKDIKENEVDLNNDKLELLKKNLIIIMHKYHKSKKKIN